MATNDLIRFNYIKNKEDLYNNLFQKDNTAKLHYLDTSVPTLSKIDNTRNVIDTSTVSGIDSKNNIKFNDITFVEDTREIMYKGKFYKCIDPANPIPGLKRTTIGKYKLPESTSTTGYAYPYGPAWSDDGTRWIPIMYIPDVADLRGNYTTTVLIFHNRYDLNNDTVNTDTISQYLMSEFVINLKIDTFRNYDTSDGDLNVKGTAYIESYYINSAYINQYRVSGSNNIISKLEGDISTKNANDQGNPLYPKLYYKFGGYTDTTNDSFAMPYNKHISFILGIPKELLLSNNGFAATPIEDAGNIIKIISDYAPYCIHDVNKKENYIDNKVYNVYYNAVTQELKLKEKLHHYTLTDVSSGTYFKIFNPFISANNNINPVLDITLKVTNAINSSTWTIPLRVALTNKNNRALLIKNLDPSIATKQANIDLFDLFVINSTDTNLSLDFIGALNISTNTIAGNTEINEPYTIDIFSNGDALIVPTTLNIANSPYKTLVTSQYK